MANHSYTEDVLHEAVHFSDEFDCAEIIAVRDYKPLESMNIFYGWRSNRDFLLYNGFVPREKNIRDIYKLKIGRLRIIWSLFIENFVQKLCIIELIFDMCQ